MEKGVPRSLRSALTVDAPSTRAAPPAKASVFTAEASRVVADLAAHRPRRYWADLLVAAAGGWGCLAACAASLWFALPASLFLFRGLMMVHPVFHLPHGKVGLRRAYNVLFGFPLLVPTFLHEGNHRFHHQRAHFATEEDPEYPHLVRDGRLAIVLCAAMSLIAPVPLIVRFGVVGPVSWFVPPLRRWTLAHFSSLAINLRYVRPAPRPSERRSWFLQELACAALLWSVHVGVIAGLLPAGVLAGWYVAGVALAALSAVQFFTLHRYSGHGGSAVVPFEEHVNDCYNVTGGIGWLTALWSPVGQRYHALHHLFPSLPYHNYGEADRRLRERFADYRSLEAAGFWPCARRLWREAGPRAAAPAGEPATATR